LTAIYPRFTHESGTIRKKQAIDVSKLKRLLCYESQHQSQRNLKSLVQFDYEKAVSNYLGTQSTFNPRCRCPRIPEGGWMSEENAVGLWLGAYVWNRFSRIPRVDPRKNLLISAAAGFFSLDATSGLLATASASAPAMFLALVSRQLWC